VVEHLPSKCEALHSKPCTPKKKSVSNEHLAPELRCSIDVNVQQISSIYYEKQNVKYIINHFYIDYMLKC
jgi:hypothetical protein